MKYECQELQGVSLVIEEIQKNIEISILKNPKKCYEQRSHPWSFLVWTFSRLIQLYISYFACEIANLRACQIGTMQCNLEQ